MAIVVMCVAPLPFLLKRSIKREMEASSMMHQGGFTDSGHDHVSRISIGSKREE
jgi:hypothetical protein